MWVIFGHNEYIFLCKGKVRSQMHQDQIRHIAHKLFFLTERCVYYQDLLSGDQDEHCH